MRIFTCVDVCMHAPIAAATYSWSTITVQRWPINAIDFIPQDELFGITNVKVGCGVDEESWSGIIGRHGLSDKNWAKEELLQFCAMNQDVIMKTWFKKKSIHYGQ